MIYTPEIREAVQKIPVPNRFNMEIHEYDLGDGGFLMLRFFYGQWLRYNEYQQREALEYLAKVQQTIGGYGVQATLDPVVERRYRSVFGSLPR